MHTPRLRGTLLCLASATFFGVAVVFARGAEAEGVGVPTMLAFRFAIAAAAFWAIVALRRTPLPGRRQVVIFAAMGAAGYALQAAFYFGALTRVDATLVGLLLYVYPAIVVALAILLRRERAELRTLAALAVSLGGLVLLLGGGLDAGTGPQARAGVAMAIGAAVTYALYVTVAEGVIRRADTFAMSAVICTSASVTTALGAALGGGLDVPSAAGLVWITGLALVSTVAAVACFFAGMRAIGASKASVLSCAEPVVTAGVAIALYGEVLTPARVAGGAAVLAAVLVLESRGLRAPGRPLPAGAVEAAGAPTA